MNRYRITNQRNGNEFVVLGETFPPQGHEVLWGQLPRTKRLSTCDTFEVTRATNPRPDPEVPAETLVDLPADFTVSTKNIDADLAADLAAKIDSDTKLDEALTRLRAVRKSDLTTLDKCADAIIDLRRAVLRLAKGE